MVAKGARLEMLDAMAGALELAPNGEDDKMANGAHVGVNYLLAALCLEATSVRPAVRPGAS